MKNRIKTLLVDDENPAREELKYLLSHMPEIQIIGEAENGEQACSMILDLKPDLVLLDIQMPGIDGFQVLNRLITRIELPHIIFITAYDRYAVNAFEVNAVDYLLKPVEEFRLRLSVEKVKTAIDQHASTTSNIREILESLDKQSRYVRRLTVKKGHHYHVIDVNDIFYISIEDGIVRLNSITVSGTTTHRSLDELQKELDPARFHRAHRAYIVNIDKIKEIIPWFSGSFKLKLDDESGTEIPLSRVQARELRKILKW